MPFKDKADYNNYMRSYRKNKSDYRKRESERVKQKRLAKAWKHQPSALDDGRIEMVDGEAVDGRYVLLGSANHGYVFNENGLTTSECLDFLLRMGSDKTHKDYRNSNSLKVVAFAFDYDVCNILIDLSQNKVKRLYFYGSVLYENYRIEYWENKRLHITRYINEEREINGVTHINKRKDKSVVIDDIYSLFNSSFLTALEAYRIPIPDRDMKKLKAGKEDRAQFTMKDIEKITEYNRLECVCGVELVKSLVKSMREAGFKTNNLYSPACMATELFQNHNIKTTLDRDLSWNSVDANKRLISKAAYEAYFGGRIECLKYGKSSLDTIEYDHNTGETFPVSTVVYSYDINSAYPYAMTQLPNLSRGHWKYKSGERCYRKDIPFALYHIRFNFPEDEDETLYPFPWRTNKGQILFPQNGTGWYWSPEVKSALEFSGNPECVEFIEAWYFVEDDSTDRPFRYINDLYLKRLKFKKENNPAEYPLKLCYNSGYGKFAQSEGAGYVKGQKPTYHQIEYAGYITALTRATLYQTVKQNHADREVIALATDGIYSLAPLIVNEGDALGQWKARQYDGIEIVQSGVYRLFHNDRITDDNISQTAWEREVSVIDGYESTDRKVWEYFGRGYLSKAVDWKRIEDGWRHNEETVKFPTRKQFISLKYASHTKWTDRLKWVAKSKKMQIVADMTKRLDLTRPDKWTEYDNPALRLFDTEPNSLFVTPYSESADNMPKYSRERNFDKYAHIKIPNTITEIDEDFFT